MRLSSVGFALSGCRLCSDESPWHGLAGAVLFYACWDAADRRNLRRAAEARFWLLYGAGVNLADIAGVGEQLRAFVEDLPPLPGQNGGPAVVELARLAGLVRPRPVFFENKGRWHVVRPGTGRTACGYVSVDLAAVSAPPPDATLCQHCEKAWSSIVDSWTG